MESDTYDFHSSSMCISRTLCFADNVFNSSFILFAKGSSIVCLTKKILRDEKRRKKSSLSLARDNLPYIILVSNSHY